MLTETIHPSEPPVVEVVITTQPKPVNTQYGSGAIFTCRAEGLPGQAITYEWYKDAKKIPSDTIGDLSLPEVTCDNEGQYHCVVSYGSRNIESDRVKLCVELGKLLCVRVGCGLSMLVKAWLYFSLEHNPTLYSPNNKKYFYLQN